MKVKYRHCMSQQNDRPFLFDAHFRTFFSMHYIYVVHVLRRQRDVKIFIITYISTLCLEQLEDHGSISTPAKPPRGTIFN